MVMTLRQKKRGKILGKARTTKEELLAAGYSPEVARTQPKSVMKAKGWLKLLDEYLPDEDLLTVTKEALKADQYDMIGKPHPHHSVRLKAAEQGYKVKGKLQPETQNNFNVGEMSVQFREKE